AELAAVGAGQTRTLERRLLRRDAERRAAREPPRPDALEREQHVGQPPVDAPVLDALLRRDANAAEIAARGNSYAMRVAHPVDADLERRDRRHGRVREREPLRLELEIDLRIRRIAGHRAGRDDRPGRG